VKAMSIIEEIAFKTIRCGGEAVEVEYKDGYDEIFPLSGPSWRKPRHPAGKFQQGSQVTTGRLIWYRKEKENVVILSPPEYSSAILILLAVSLVSCQDSQRRAHGDVIIYSITERPGAKPLANNPTVYRINAQTQTVTYWSRFDPAASADSHFNAPARLVNCAIRDTQNWKCEYPDGSGTVAIVNGKYSELNAGGHDPAKDAHIRYVSQREWEAIQASWK
jgi:hypothetical protein